MPGGRTLSLAQARRIALAAQGFADKRSSSNPNRGHLSRLTERLGVVQIDSVNVLARSHYLPGFARLGAYERGHLEDLAWGRRPRLFEYWGHEASLLPLDLQPYFRWRMEDAAAGKGIYRGLVKFARENRDFIQAIKREIEVKGPSGAGKLEGSGKGEGGWWGWSPGKIALEWLFWAGEITTKTRNNFERIYDLTERAIPADVLARPTPSKSDAIRHLLERSAAALGVASLAELRDYYRLPVEGFKTRLQELIESGVVEPVALEGQRVPYFLHQGARLPRKVEGQALLSPFDNLIWERDRTQRLFNFRYRLEIYTPGPKREFGYYVLPFLMDESLAARVCLKSDRAADCLKVNAAHGEAGINPAATAERLAKELRALATWLGLSHVHVGRRGDLAAAVAREVKAGL